MIDTPTLTEEDIILQDIQSDMSEVTSEMMASKMEQAKLFQQAALEGGPTNQMSAIGHLMTYTKLGVRRLAVMTQIRRKVLQRMLDGEKEMSADDFSKIYQAICSRLPPHMQANQIDATLATLSA